MQKIGIISQARMTSTRLPGKIFKEAAGKTLLDHHISRLQQTGLEVAIATTINSSDDCVADYAMQRGIPLHRGSEHHVLGRFYEAAEKFGYEIIVRVTSDCPLIDPHLIRNSVEKYLRFNNPRLYMSNALQRSFARGFDFEIFSFLQLKEAFDLATDTADTEHVTPYIYKNTGGKNEFYHVVQQENNSKFRITVDTPEDYELITTLIEDFNADKLDYHSIEQLLKEHPELVAINQDIEQKKL